MKSEEKDKSRLVWGLAKDDDRIKICPLQVDAGILFIDKYKPASEDDSKLFIELLKNILK